MEPDVGLNALGAAILELEERWTEALVQGDVDAVRSFMRDDFSITTAGWLDAPADRETWLAHAFERFRLDSFSFDDLRVRRYGEVVVAQVRCRQRGTDLVAGGPWAMVFRYTDVWIPDGNSCRIAVRQATGRPWTDADTLATQRA